MGWGDWNGSPEDYDMYASSETEEEKKAREEKERLDEEERCRQRQIWRANHPIEAQAEDDRIAEWQRNQAARRAKEESRKESFGCLVYLSIFAFIAWLIFFSPPGNQIIMTIIFSIIILGLIEEHWC